MPTAKLGAWPQDAGVREYPAGSDILPQAPLSQNLGPQGGKAAEG